MPHTRLTQQAHSLPVPPYQGGSSHTQPLSTQAHKPSPFCCCWAKMLTPMLAAHPQPSMLHRPRRPPPPHQPRGAHCMLVLNTHCCRHKNPDVTGNVPRPRLRCWAGGQGHQPCPPALCVSHWGRPIACTAREQCHPCKASCTPDMAAPHPRQPALMRKVQKKKGHMHAFFGRLQEGLPEQLCTLQTTCDKTAKKAAAMDPPAPFSPNHPPTHPAPHTTPHSHMFPPVASVAKHAS